MHWSQLELYNLLQFLCPGNPRVAQPSPSGAHSWSSSVPTLLLLGSGMHCFRVACSYEVVQVRHKKKPQKQTAVSFSALYSLAIHINTSFWKPKDHSSFFSPSPFLLITCLPLPFPLPQHKINIFFAFLLPPSVKKHHQKPTEATVLPGPWDNFHSSLCVDLFS